MLLKVELFILHVRAATTEDAQALLQAAMQSGFRESGISLGEATCTFLPLQFHFTVVLPR